MDQSLSGIAWRLGGVLGLVLANGFFVAAEFSIVAVRKTRIDQLIAEGHRGALAVRRAVTDPDRYIAATQLGITMASLGLGWIGEPALAAMIQPAFASLPAYLAESTAHSIAVAIAFTIITTFHIVFGELAPKWIALERSEATALLIVKPTELFMRALWPFIRLMHGMARAVITTFGIKNADTRAMVHSEEELKMLVTASQEAGVLEEHEEQMLHRVFGFADLAAGQVMVPRTEVVAIPAGATRDEIVSLITRYGHTRLPVYREDLDHVIGILHVTDLLKAIVESADVNVAALAKEALTVPVTLGADDLLVEMRRRGVREALVIDEYGGTAGLVTFETLMARIVGDLGMGDAGRPKIDLRPDGSANIDGLTLVTDVNERFGLHIDATTYTTVGGFVLGRLGRRPRVGDAIDVDGRRVRVEAIDGIRVAKLWLSRPKKRAASEEAGNSTDHHDGHDRHKG
jgi:CBS domain containing-hemolysin-like protein